MVKKSAERIYLAIIFLFLYLPIVVLIILSFNDSKTRVQWGGFTLKWYKNLFSDSTIMAAFGTTVLISLASALFATLLGTLAALGIDAMKKRSQAIMIGATNIPLLNADIVTGISMMLLFVRFTRLGMNTVLIAHITFNIPYVILNVLPRLKQSSRTTYEAALDLGATPLYAFVKIIWPQIRPGVLSGFLMAMTMSLDDFSVTYFTKGAGINTLSTMIYTEMRKGIRPEMYALSTILFLLALVLLLFMNFGPSARKEKKGELSP
ncbi:spermidine/putrescine transport system permease [Eubacterium sp. 14-2]|uniref:ABC transporter permease n=1 Tax=Eubacterium sp. 14-2 TaxID=1235790 RepID=UPI0003371892|nr:ABC transporter permease [Eubacterium sp. 14-2]EOT27174.1 spermidine/putrescine transport system permease [Eubacterium sp. 14-2]